MYINNFKIIHIIESHKSKSKIKKLHCTFKIPNNEFLFFSNLKSKLQNIIEADKTNTIYTDDSNSLSIINCSMDSFPYNNLPFLPEFYKMISEKAVINIKNINLHKNEIDFEIKKLLIELINKAKTTLNITYPQFDSVVFDRQHLDLTLRLDFNLINSDFSYFEKALNSHFELTNTNDQTKLRDQVSLNSIKLKNHEDIEIEKLPDPFKTDRIIKEISTASSSLKQEGVVSNSKFKM